MSIWAIAYDLDVSGMKSAGYTKSKVTMFYNNIRSCLQTNHFEKLKQWSVYTSEKPNSLADAFAVCVSMKAVQDSDKFVKRLHLFRIEDFNDLLPLVANGKLSDEADEIAAEIEDAFESEAA
jgi:virulence-associated protein VapD